MKIKLTCLSLAAFTFATCDKNADSDSTSSRKPGVENRVETSSGTETPAQEASEPSAGNPADTARAEASPEPPTAEQMIARFNSEGIAGVPKDVADAILRKSTGAGTPEEQVRFITEQSAAWHHINEFKESDTGIPDHMKRMLIETLYTKHGDSWKDMAAELDEQVAASNKVMELRLNGIPGMTPDESQDFLINALEQHGSDYKTILSIAEKSARK